MAFIPTWMAGILSISLLRIIFLGIMAADVLFCFLDQLFVVFFPLEKLHFIDLTVAQCQHYKVALKIHTQAITLIFITSGHTAAIPEEKYCI